MQISQELAEQWLKSRGYQHRFLVDKFGWHGPNHEYFTNYEDAFLHLIGTQANSNIGKEMAKFGYWCMDLHQTLLEDGWTHENTKTYCLSSLYAQPYLEGATAEEAYDIDCSYA